MLSTLAPQPADALLALIKLYAADPRADKIDLGVGVYRTDTGATPVFAAIKAADLITLGPGSLFTSVIANLIVPGIAAALANSRAQKIFICNAMTEYDETDGLSAVDHVRTLLAYAPDLRLDDALFNSTPISAEMRERYAAERAVALDPPATIPADLAGIRFTSLPLASESRFVRHDPPRLGRVILELAGVSHSRIDAV